MSGIGPTDRRPPDVQARALSERTPIDWEARYRDRTGEQWLRCRLMDISVDGAGVLLLEDTAGPLKAVTLELRTPGGTDVIELSGEVRHSSVTDGRRRIGIQFVDVGPYEESALRDVVARRLGLAERRQAR